MKIIVANAMAPFVWGGAEELAHHLIVNLRALGHDAELYRMPFSWDPFGGIPAEMARLKALRLPPADRVISMKFPIYLTEAEHHTTWLIHQYRQAYDLWDSPYCNIPHDAAGRAVRDLIVAHDNAALGSRDRLFSISHEISSRLLTHNGITAEPLRAPLNDPQLFTGGPYGDYILAPGRINASKRQHLLVQALRYADKGTRLIVAGPPESAADGDSLHELVEKHGLRDRVKLDLRFLSRQELADYVNGARAVAYLPYGEDSYGYVTMEAFEAGKPVITTSDAGELLEIVRDGQTGRVAKADPRELGEVMSAYTRGEAMARGHGLAGQALWRAKGINWPENISRLLGN
jgi:glycosyltransferase involved in cell wall biosynthesis